MGVQQRCNIPDNVARRVAEDIYGAYGKVIGDLVVTEKERERLDWLSGALRLDGVDLGLIGADARRGDTKML